MLDDEPLINQAFWKMDTLGCNHDMGLFILASRQILVVRIDFLLSNKRFASQPARLYRGISSMKTVQINVNLIYENRPN